MAPLGRDERLWLSVSLIWCLILFAMMWAWPFIGEQNTPVESYRVLPADFRAATEEYMAAIQVGVTDGGIPIVAPDPGDDVYLEARMFEFRPVLELQQGETYRLLVSSTDVQHGLSFQPVNLNFQVLPGYVYVIRITPTEPGIFGMVCNEYCGFGHHQMIGKVIVTE